MLLVLFNCKRKSCLFTDICARFHGQVNMYHVVLVIYTSEVGQFERNHLGQTGELPLRNDGPPP